MMQKSKVPEISITRLFIYLRALKNIKKTGVATISSENLAERIGFNPNQVRKDLSYFGQFGRRGVGYDIDQLISSITNILGLNRRRKMAICGIGNLGSALFAYKGFKDQGFDIVALFDNDQKKIGKKWDGIKVEHSERLESVVKKRDIEIAVIAVPVNAAQQVVDKFIKAGVKTFLNFTPTKLSIPREVKLRNVDLSVELVNLSHYLAKGLSEAKLDV